MKPADRARLLALQLAGAYRVACLDETLAAGLREQGVFEIKALLLEPLALAPRLRQALRRCTQEAA